MYLDGSVWGSYVRMYVEGIGKRRMIDSSMTTGYFIV